MPKKFSTENPKAVAARERKKAVKDAEISKKQQQQEDAYWQDEDKQIKKKQQRKEEQDRKREQQQAKKAEAKLLLEKEMSSIKSGKANPPPKITRAQINATVNTPKKDTEKKEKIITHLDEPLEENVNRLKIEGEEARTVTEAIGILSSKTEDEDKHPERRMKAAYTAFENRRLEELKIENPSLRLSQLKQMIFKEWQKSPENPLNK
ncbi:coiled-coil domain-containing protein 124 [Asbolus verrucosus]|uniref:Coiled-coil domain-containing protein 124 n=1 Tax=Asbolus verrucosus TaxID=1661398 RepID=A0A482W615_ASBVE|nr:coiled-coil domain-containing protein 124 [Asbolus verrucosus]